MRDAGDRHGINHRIRDEARLAPQDLAQVLLRRSGPQTRQALWRVHGTDVDDAASIQTTVQRQARDNDEIKLILRASSTLMRARSPTSRSSTASGALVVDTAHAAGRKVFAHCSGERGLAVAVAAGVDSIEHGFFMTRAILSQMRDRQLAWVPTFCPVHFQWAEPAAVGWCANTIGNLRRILDNHAEHLRMAHELGVTVLVGTDAGSMGVEHGLAMAQEIERFLEAGLPLQAVLRAATSSARRHFDHPFPVLAVGAPFDAMQLRASPWQEFAALRSVERVWSSGVGVRAGAD